MIGQFKEDFELVSYQSGWIDHFNREANLLKSTLGKKALQIEHVGSTSISGMAAKAIIDIMVAVPAMIRLSELIYELDSIGYTYKPFDTIPERIFFGKEIQPEIRTHNLNLTQKGSEFWKNQLLFRDYLRENDQLALEYIQLKKSFAEYYARTNHIEVEWKSNFVARVLKLAKDEL
ncbi:MAG: GrpB family protein [Anaerolineales bacterium]